MLAELFHLRYFLLWRAATRSKARLLLFVAYHAVLLLSAIMAFNSAVVIELVRLGGDAQLRLLEMSMWMVYFGTIASAIFVGMGGEGTFSAAALRRYPLSTWQRQSYSHLLTLTTPVWIGCFVFSLSCALALSTPRIISVTWRLPAALAFFCASYLSAAVLSSLLRFTITRKTWLVGAAAAFTTILFSVKATGSLPAWTGPVAFWSPPGLFTAILRSQNVPYSLTRSIALIAWVVMLFLFFDLCSEERVLAGKNRHGETKNVLHVPTEVV